MKKTPNKVIRIEQADGLDVSLHLDLLGSRVALHQEANDRAFGDRYEDFVTEVMTDPMGTKELFLAENSRFPRAVILGEKFVMDTEFWRTGQYVLESLLKNENNKLVITASLKNKAEILKRIPYDKFPNVKVAASLAEGIEAAKETGFEVEESHMVVLAHPEEKDVPEVAVLTLNAEEAKDRRSLAVTHFFDILTLAFLLAKRGGEIPEQLVKNGLLQREGEVVRVSLSMFLAQVAAIPEKEKAALTLLWQLDNEREISVTALASALWSENGELKYRAAGALRKAGPDATKPLLQLLKSETPDDQLAAVTALGLVVARGAAKAVFEKCQSPDAGVAEAAQKSWLAYAPLLDREVDGYLAKAEEHYLAAREAAANKASFEQPLKELNKELDHAKEIIAEFDLVDKKKQLETIVLHFNQGRYSLPEELRTWKSSAEPRR